MRMADHRETVPNAKEVTHSKAPSGQEQPFGTSISLKLTLSCSALKRRGVTCTPFLSASITMLESQPSVTAWGRAAVRGVIANENLNNQTAAQASAATEITFPRRRNLQTPQCYWKWKHLFLSVDLQILIVQSQFSVLHTVNEFAISLFAVIQPDKKIKFTIKFRNTGIKVQI